MMKRLEQDVNQLTGWFPQNYLKLNEDKCHLILLGASEGRVNIHVGEARIEGSDAGKLLDINLD